MNTMWSHALLEAQDKMMLEGPRPRGYLPIATRSALRPEYAPFLLLETRELTSPCAQCTLADG
jgi:hypothetical protein